MLESELIIYGNAHFLRKYIAFVSKFIIIDTEFCNWLLVYIAVNLLIRRIDVFLKGNTILTENISTNLFKNSS